MIRGVAKLERLSFREREMRRFKSDLPDQNF